MALHRPFSDGETTFRLKKQPFCDTKKPPTVRQGAFCYAQREFLSAEFLPFWKASESFLPSFTLTAR
jgi:hypothetical protein